MDTHCDTWVMGVSSVSPSRSRSSAKLFVLKKWGVLTSSSVGLFLTVEKVWDSSLGFSRNLIMKGHQSWTEMPTSTCYCCGINLCTPNVRWRMEATLRSFSLTHQVYTEWSRIGESVFRLAPRYLRPQHLWLSDKGRYFSSVWQLLWDWAPELKTCPVRFWTSH